ncbi:MAG: MBL fold metallo-hydrolase, partial [Myxococcales bacterium]
MAEVTVQVELREAGRCSHPESMVMKGGSLRPVPFPARFAVVRHPSHGIVLYDTGYSPRFLEETEPFPNRLYRWMTPPVLHAGETAAEQLRAAGIGVEDVGWVVLSHFHADHIAGIADFPRARYVAGRQGLQFLRGAGRLNALLHGVLPGLLPSDFEARAQLFGPEDFAGPGLGGLPA